jgi:hypothetical protein
MGHPETERQMVERHVREGEEHVARQLKCIADLNSRGQPSDLAKRLLESCVDALDLHRSNLERLRLRAP